MFIFSFGYYSSLLLLCDDAFLRRWAGVDCSVAVKALEVSRASRCYLRLVKFIVLLFFY